MSSLAWQIARRYLGASSETRSEADWPDALTPEEITCLQYPSEGTDAEKSKARKYRSALFEAIKIAIDAGELATTSRSKKVPITESRIDYEAMHRRKLHYQKMGISEDWGSRDTPPPARQVKTGEAIKEIQVVPCFSFAIWFAAQEKPFSESIHAWCKAKDAASAKVGAGRTPPATDSRPGERQAYFRTLWMEFDKPRMNHKIWAAIKKRRGLDGCPVTAVTGDVEFTFRYSDDGTDVLQRIKFQQDMSAVRKG